jgi:hypothetical protein
MHDRPPWEYARRIMAEQISEQSARDRVLAEVGRKNDAIAAAFEDLDAIVDEPGTWWVDFTDASTVKAYAVTGEWRHAFKGPIVQRPAGDNPDARYESSCAHTSHRITVQAKFAAQVKRPASFGPTTFATEWRFDGITADPLHVISDPQRSDGALRFAHALARAVLASIA